ncbi:hypothetical protein AAC387_Pa03g3167 [Persea americana]
MGAACCCLRGEDSEEQLHPNTSTCICLRFFVQKLYTALFLRGGQAAYSSIEGVAPVSSPGQVESSLDTSVLNAYRSPPRPLPYDVDPRCSRLQHGPVSRCEKSSSHFHEESQPPIRSNSNAGLEALGAADKRNGPDYEWGSKDFSEYLSRKAIGRESYIFSPTEDEDVCPTCLEEYTTENPRIITQCSHHFHLGCIYEWMERSETCPVCGQTLDGVKEPS